MKNIGNYFCVIIVLLISAFHASADPLKQTAAYYQAQDLLTKAMVNDIFPPPAAARVYAYTSLAALQASGSENVNKFKIPCREMPKVFAAGKTVDLQVASVLALLYTGHEMVYTNYALKAFASQIEENLSQNKGTAVAAATKKHAEIISQSILAWAAADKYNRIKNSNNYQVFDRENSWEPTPPGYMMAILPRWFEIRPFLIDSASQFRTVSPPGYSKTDTSTYVRSMKEVYQVSKSLTADQRATAAFWDCNPYVMSTGGHAAFAAKKISPGGHWMGIASLVCQQKNLPLDSSLYVHALLGVTLADAFIACWDQKYHSHYIRPETAIRRDLDPAWQPMLQTPPFPEYTSGHSVVSTAAAEVLTKVLGDVSFNDTVEVSYGLPARNFTSFKSAAAEAALSRLYGGIHFRHAVEHGVTQGRQVARLIISRL